MKPNENVKITEKDKRLYFGEPLSISPSNEESKSIKPYENEDLPKPSQIIESKQDLQPYHNHNQYKSPIDLLQKLVIRVTNTYKSMWDIFILLLICYSCMTSAYYVAFSYPTNSGLVAFENLVEVCFAVDIILRFFHEYRDPESFEYVNDVRKIAKNYITGWFLLDFLAVFPFNLIMSNQNTAWLKLLRMLRLPKFMRLLDYSKFDHIIESLLENTSRQTKMNYLYASKYIYKVIRLIFIGATLTYFMGCLWYYISSNQVINPGTKTFNYQYNLINYSDFRKLVMCCYFALTTLATVGYGDLTPQSNLEKIIGILVMILGIALFSYIMGNFNDVLINYDKQMGIVDKSSNLQAWLTSLSKFTANCPLPRELIQKIDEHFKYFWQNDRLSSLTINDKYLQQMPDNLKHSLIKYLFDDIFVVFRGFLLTNEFKDTPFYYEIAFEFLPRKYDPDEMVLEQGEVVHEVYLIKEGSVHIYFEYRGEKIGRCFGRGYYFGNFNIFKNVKSEFNYQAIKTADNLNATKIFAIPKQKLLKLLKNYPDICSRMIESSKRTQNSLRDLLKYELKLKLTLQNPNITASEIDQIFREEILHKYKPETTCMKVSRAYLPKNKVDDVNNDLNNTDDSVENLIKSMNHYNKIIVDDLNDITDRLHKIKNHIINQKSQNDI